MSNSLLRSIYRYQNVIYYIVEGEAISKRFRTVYNKENRNLSLTLDRGEVVKGTKIIIYQLSRVSFQYKFFTLFLLHRQKIKVKKINQKNVYTHMER